MTATILRNLLKPVNPDAFVLGLLVACAGCGATQSKTATEQLLISDAVDATVSQLDFSPLTDKKVYLDATYIKTLKSPLLIDSDYVISSLRQQMVGAGVLLVENRNDADLVAEARIGALGLDGHNVTYGIPSSNALSSASQALSGSPILPSLPEVSLARHEAKSGAAKIAVFAYERESRERFWQSGVAKSSSSARDTWVLGVGPWQKGSIYERTRFAGSEIDSSHLVPSNSKDHDADIRKSPAFASYLTKRIFARKDKSVSDAAGSDADSSMVVPASAEGQAKETAETINEATAGDSVGKTEIAKDS